MLNPFINSIFCYRAGAGRSIDDWEAHFNTKLVIDCKVNNCQLIGNPLLHSITNRGK